MCIGGRGADSSALLRRQAVQNPGLDLDSVNIASSALSSKGMREFILEPRMSDCGVGTQIWLSPNTTSQHHDSSTKLL